MVIETVSEMIVCRRQQNSNVHSCRSPKASAHPQADGPLRWSRLLQVFGSGINGCHGNTWTKKEHRSEVLVRMDGVSMTRFWRAYQRSEVAAVIMSLVVGHNFVLEVLNLLRVSALINNEDVLRSHSNSPFN